MAPICSSPAAISLLFFDSNGPLYRLVQMYNIYFNDSQLLLCTGREMNTYQQPNDLCIRYQGKVKQLHNYIDLLEKSPNVKRVILWDEDVKSMYADFKGLFRFLRAAGGVVEAEGKIAVIKRHGVWDLPKGKIETGEKKKPAARREITEEIGLELLSIEAKLGSTYHVYRDSKDRRVLKKTHWYRFSGAMTELVGQQEEGIEEALWMDAAAFARKRPIYASILRVMGWYMGDGE